jgi:hypothetical protein
MFFQETTPNTSGYMIAGYVITFIVLGIYVASMYLRHRNYRQDMTLLEEMEKPAVSTRSDQKPRAGGRPAKTGTEKGGK